MKRHQTAKYKKRQKKERANRKARQLSTHNSEEATPKDLIDHLRREFPKQAEPVSPARRAFQDT